MDLGHVRLKSKSTFSSNPASHHTLLNLVLSQLCQSHTGVSQAQRCYVAPPKSEFPGAELRNRLFESTLGEFMCTPRLLKHCVYISPVILLKYISWFTGCGFRNLRAYISNNPRVLVSILAIHQCHLGSLEKGDIHPGHTSTIVSEPLVMGPTRHPRIRLWVRIF